MNSLERRIDKLEEERMPDAEALRRDEELRRAIEEARQRVRAADPGHEFSDIGDASLLPGGRFDLAAALERGRRRARERILAGA